MYTRYSLLDLFFGITFGDNKAYINFNTLKTNATKFQGIKNSHTAFNLFQYLTHLALSISFEKSVWARRARIVLGDWLFIHELSYFQSLEFQLKQLI